MSTANPRLDEPINDFTLETLTRWYEDEAASSNYASSHDCFLVRALRELKRRRQAVCHTHGIPGCDHPDHWGVAS